MTLGQDTPAPLRPTPGQDPARLFAAEDIPQDDSARWAVSMLREATPFTSSPGSRERVWNSLPDLQPARPARLRLALAMSALLVCGLFASAALAQWPAWLAAAIENIVSKAPESPPAAPAQIRRAMPSERPAAPTLSPVVPRATVAVPSPAKAEAPSVSPPRRAARAATSEDLQPVLEAVRALRVEHNSARARSLMTDYLALHPKSELAEEALVTLIQAAAAHHDSDVPALAARYFKTYPRGPLRHLVDQTLNAGTGAVPARSRAE